MAPEGLQGRPKDRQERPKDPPEELLDPSEGPRGPGPAMEKEGVLQNMYKNECIFNIFKMASNA